MDRSDIRAQDVGFEAGIAALYPRLFQLALRLCRNHADARDLAQDAVERGLRHRVLFRTQGSPDRWMFTILRRIFVDDCRGRRRRRPVPLLESHPAITASEAEPPAAWEDFSLEDVQQALMFLDRSGREAFSLFVLARLPQREISRRLSISPRTVATRVFRARAKLREILESGAHRRPLTLVAPAAAPPAVTATPFASWAHLSPHPARTDVAVIQRCNRVTASGPA